MTTSSPENDVTVTAAEGDPSQEAPEAVTPKEGEQPLPADIAELSYEAARDQLVEVVRRLESGQGGLEDSIALWERGEMLARRCQQWTAPGSASMMPWPRAARRTPPSAEPACGQRPHAGAASRWSGLTLERRRAGAMDRRSDQPIEISAAPASCSSSARSASPWISSPKSSPSQEIPC